jgi:hypothetical protein
VEEGNREADGGGTMNWYGMREYRTEPSQPSIPSNLEREAKPVVVLASRSGEARRQKGRLGRGTVGRDWLAGV